VPEREILGCLNVSYRCAGTWGTIGAIWGITACEELPNLAIPQVKHLKHLLPDFANYPP